MELQRYLFVNFYFGVDFVYNRFKKIRITKIINRPFLFFTKSHFKKMPNQKPRLLVVDDEIDQVGAIKSYFSKRNFLVFSAANGQKPKT